MDTRLLPRPPVLRDKLALYLAIASTPLLAQKFEVASIREHHDNNVFRSGPLTVTSPLIRLEGYTIYGLVMDAWNLRDFQLRFAREIPKDDVYGKMYDIAARAPGPAVPPIADVRLMLQNLLADRFQIKVRRQPEDTQVYLLEAAKTGLKLQPASTTAPCQVHTGLAPDGRNDDETFSNCPLERLADRLKEKIDNRPILDKTGLTGAYNIHLVAIPELRSRRGPEPADIDPRTALRDMGLTLTPAKAAVDVITVDRLEKLTAN